ncbi:XRE family transcriptional regulator [Rhizobium rhizogenes]
MRICLLRAIRDQIRAWKITRPQAATRLGISVGKVGDLLSENLENISLNELLRLSPLAGLTARFEVQRHE